MNLRDFLTATGMTQAQFADQMQAGHRTVGNWVRDGAPLAVLALLEACRRLEPQKPDNALSALLGAVAAKSEKGDTP